APQTHFSFHIPEATLSGVPSSSRSTLFSSEKFSAVESLTRAGGDWVLVNGRVGAGTVRVSVAIQPLRVALRRPLLEFLGRELAELRARSTPSSPPTQPRVPKAESGGLRIGALLSSLLSPLAGCELDVRAQSLCVLLDLDDSSPPLALDV